MNKLYKHFSVLFLIILGLRIFDIFRALLIASKLGVSQSADIFMAVVLIPDSILVLTGLDSLKGVMNSEFSSIKGKANNKYLFKIFNDILIITLIISLILTIFIVIYRSTIIGFLLPGFNGPAKTIAISLAAIIFPTIVLKALMIPFQAVFNALEKYYFQQSINILLTVTIIVSVFLPYINNNLIFNLGLATFLGVFLILGSYVIFFLYNGGRFSFKNFSFEKSTKSIIKNCLLLFSLLIVEQLFNSSKNFFASLDSEGAISSLNYARAIPATLMGLLFSATFSVLVTNISKSYSVDNINLAGKIFWDSISVILFILIPIVVIFLLCGNEILTLFYQRGNFSQNDVQRSLDPFSWESLSIISFIMYIIPTALFLATKNYKLLNYSGSIVYLGGILVNYIMFNLWGYVGISAANFIVTLIYGMILMFYSRKIIGSSLINIYRLIFLFLSGIIAYFVTAILKYLIGNYLFNNVLILAAVSISVIGIYLLVSNLFGLKYLYTLKQLLIQKIIK